MDKYLVSSSPHVRSGETTARLMRDVLTALLPAVGCAVYFFGWSAVWMVLVSVGTAVGVEALLQVLMKRKVTVSDGSAAVTGLLLALCLPPLQFGQFWLPMIGSAFAIAIVKMCFGGLGYNFLNPALAARAFLTVSWLGLMTTWTMPVDAVSTATPLAAVKLGEALPSGYMDMLLGNVGGCIGETSALALLAGGIYLIARRVIDWRIPVSYLVTVALFSWIAGFNGAFTGDPIYNVLGGGLMLGAFYMATDYVTSPISRTGRIVFGIGCGVLTTVIRRWGGYAEGVCYAILLMNLVVPLLDSAFKPKLFGQVAKEAAK